jgi:pSer/pThr/pTyr-binding forkhead associated (FHA) protein
MQVELKMLRGSLKSTDGKSAGPAVRVNKTKFLVGRGDDCHLCCKSDAISRHHCVLLVNDRGVSVHDLGSKNGTFVNDERVDREHSLNSGDRLKIGRLEFEVSISALQGAVGPQVAASNRAASKPSDDGGISDLLIAADELDRQSRSTDPGSRKYVPEETVRLERDETAIQKALDEKEQKKKETPAKKKEPGKLPRPKFTGDDSVDAAAKMLSKMFGRPGK